ncbi:MAG: DUF72 domain-containing protein [Elusimicrobia bacterium]|nr:DUF72 domain-containing protein [Elusimicrobiota bacterium]MBD3411505.1 DUF72 domain-containing protein [Elusimicrobiota bacterium]
MNTIIIGTSGWHYTHWIGPFYPHNQDRKRFFEYYKNIFQTVEINNSFYRLPKKEVLRDWHNAAPEGFIFSIKASRYITHVKRLKEPVQSLKKFIEVLPYLKNSLGPVLFQLPPRFRCNHERLEQFLQALPRQYRYTFEFRDTSWFNDKTYALLSDHRCALCLYYFEEKYSPLVVTADFVYIRLHGSEDKYTGKYSPTQIREWATRILEWHAHNKRIYCYFDNDQYGYAPQNARELIAQVSQQLHKK